MMANIERPIIASIVQYTDAIETGEMTVMQLLQKAADLGLDGIELRRELWGEKMKVELPVVRDRADELGLLVTFATHSVLFCEGDDRDMLLADVDTAAEIGSPLLRIFSGPVPEDCGAPEWDWAKRVIDRGASKGILIALENYADSPGGTLAEILTVLNHFDVPTLKTNIDTGNYAGWKQDHFQAIEAIGDRTVYVHIKDPREGGTSVPGEGDLPIMEILTALDRYLQRIIYCFEFPGGDDPDDRIARGLAFMQSR